jgi:hypothetical protein
VNGGDLTAWAGQPGRAYDDMRNGRNLRGVITF